MNSLLAIRRRSRVGVAILVLAAVGCSKSAGDGAGAGGSSGPCDPLTPPPTTLGAILGVGEDTQSIFYVADEAADSGGQDRVFVSNGTTLDRQHVAGSGQSGGPPNADYTFSFDAPFADAGDTRALLLHLFGVSPRRGERGASCGPSVTKALRAATMRGLRDGGGCFMKVELRVPHFLRVTQALAFVSGFGLPIIAGCGSSSAPTTGGASDGASSEDAAYEASMIVGGGIGIPPYDGGPLGIIVPLDGGHVVAGGPLAAPEFPA